ncbi:MAG: hypothetical protein EBZ44_05545 [Verrucomicrobia bacterium]|nr:hypothetical protein [Verrucomicrobiota bacterium]NDD82063.1 hypothetical protein [Verrucomicrobiota bacterium]
MANGHGGKRLKAGRRKGIPNKFTADLKAMILGALSDKGGQAYLARQADENPTAFMGLLGKVLPTTLQGDPNAPLKLVIMTGVDRDEPGR